MASNDRHRILREGNTCWRIAKANKLTFLVDAAAYFEAFAEAVQRAARSIYIAAWDIDSRLLLQRGSDSALKYRRLGELLNEKTTGTRGLHTYILAWDFSMLFVREREWLPILNLGWKTHRRVHFHLDGRHPIGASQHEKLVVIDDRIAFCGSIDLTKNRWDTPEHMVDNPLRCDNSGPTYGPYHEVQILMDGDAAAALGQLFRERWKRATGKHLTSPDPADSHPWPAAVRPDMTDLTAGIVRTQPAFLSEPEVRETEELFRAAIGAALSVIYIETQYLTSAAIAQALGEILVRPTGPEIVIVMPQASSGWLEQNTMDAIRCRLLTSLFEKDRHGRLAVYYPAVGILKAPVYVHSKLMIVDNRLAVVGSANLNNRSMGLDRECSLAVEASRSPHHQAIEVFRNRLLAEHLGCLPANVEEAVRDHRSIIRAIEHLGTAQRRLERLNYHTPPTIDAVKLLDDAALLDPERPMEFEQILDEFCREADESGWISWRLRLSLSAGFLLAMAAAWHWTPLREWLSIDRLAAWGWLLQNDVALVATAIATFTLGGLVMAPVTLIIGATAIVLSPMPAALVSLSGCLISAALGYGIGAKIGRNQVRRIAGKRLKRLNQRMAKRGILASVIIRNLPLAPFTIVNVLAGASRIKFSDYMIGTGIGMLPGIVAISIFADRLAAAVYHPDWQNILIVTVVVIALGLGFWWLHHRLSGPKPASAPE